MKTKWAEYKEKIIDAIGLVDFFAKELHFNYSYLANDNSVSDPREKSHLPIRELTYVELGIAAE